MKLHRINALLLKYYYISINRIDRIFDIIYWPMIDLFVWGFASFYIKSLSNVNILSMLLGGIILWSFAWRTQQDVAVFVLEDFWSKNLYHLFSSPVKISEHLASIIIFGFARSIVTFIVMGIVAFLLYSFSILSIPIIPLMISIALLSLFGWMMGLFITSFIFRYGQRIQVLAWSVVWVIQPFSCVFYPLSSLPGWAAAIAKFTPTMYVFENLRLVLSTGTYNTEYFIMSLLLTIVYGIAVVMLLSSSFRSAKKKGFLAKAT